jgi:hypothetical protein
MARIKQVFDVPPPIENLTVATGQALKRLRLDSKIRPGETVAVTAGSRGIANISIIIKSIIDELKAIGAQPFIVPAMGSHGGATSAGQAELLSELGITEKSLGVPIKSSMNVIKVGNALGFPVYLDKFSCEADHIAVVARIKPHTDFKGEIESGFYKMMIVGLGKHKGATVFHQASVRYGHSRVLREFGREVIKKAKIAFGLGIVENAYGQTAKIVAAPPSNMMSTEKQLLRLAKSWMMKLPFDEIDVLIIDELGKDVSGDGMDPNVTGRFGPGFNRSQGPKIARIVVLDLTKKTHGNALGLGRADFATKRLVQKIDRQTTYTNALTCRDLEEAKIPVYFDTDREAIRSALESAGVSDSKAKVLRIKNTLALGEIEISEGYLPFLGKRKDLVMISGPQEMQFDSEGKLAPFHGSIAHPKRV